MNNNTVSRNEALSAAGRGGGLQGNYTGVNNIIYGNYAVTGPEIYEGYFMFNYSCCSTSISGTGNITDDPMFVNPDSLNFYLQSGSPCVDTGDPNSPLDPDSTRADMGCFYFDQSAGSPVSVTLIPYNPPIQIPAMGGSFDYNIAVNVNEAMPQTFDIWTMVTLPNGSPYGPLLGPVNLTLSGGASASRDRTQIVPSGAPAGAYAYVAYVGSYPDDIWDEDSFPFEKLGINGGGWTDGWFNRGESFVIAGNPGSAVPASDFHLSSLPNPFNSQTVLNFTLSVPGEVTLVIHDVRGRVVANLIDQWLQPGTYPVVLDGSRLSSGIYLALMKSGGSIQTLKLLHLK
jgi:hypothetical protein